MLDPRLLQGRFPSRNRAWFLLRRPRRAAGGAARPRRRPRRARGPAGGGAARARARGGRGGGLLRLRRLAVRDGARPAGRGGARAGSRCGGSRALFVADIGQVRTKDGRPHSVFSPFHRALGAGAAPRGPRRAAAARLPLRPRGRPAARRRPSRRRASPFAPGERAGRERARRVAARRPRALPRAPRPARGRDLRALALPALRLPLAARARAARPRARRPGADAFVRQLAWRDFYAHVLLHNPGNARHALPARVRRARVGRRRESCSTPGARAAPASPSSTPAMRQLLARGLDAQPRPPDRRLLPDQGPAPRLAPRRGATSCATCCAATRRYNNGNWQWIASVGVDPAPYFRRMYNPMTQQRRHDPDGEYVRRWLPELREVPDAKLAEPWTMSEDEQRAAGCVIGADYPAPVVDHKGGARAGDGALPRGRATRDNVRARRGPALRAARPAARRAAAGAHRRAHAARRPGGELLVPPPPRRLRVDRRSGSAAGAWSTSPAARATAPRCWRARAASVVGVDANPEAFEHARLKYTAPEPELRAQHDRAVAGRRRLRRVPADDRARAGSRRDARARARR